MIRLDISIAIAVKIHIVQIAAAGLAIVLQRTLVTMQHSRKMFIYRGRVSIETAWLRSREYPLNEIVVLLYLSIRELHNILMAVRDALVLFV